MPGSAERRISYLTKEEVERLFAVIPESEVRDRLLFDVIYRYGLRRGEAALLLKDRVSADRIWVGRLKGGVPGEYPVHPVTARLLEGYLSERRWSRSPYLFVTRESRWQPMSTAAIAERFRLYANAAGLPADRRHVHCLRHAIAVHLLNASWDLLDVKEWLGHSSVTSTLVYARVTNRRRDQKYELALASGELAGVPA